MTHFKNIIAVLLAIGTCIYIINHFEDDMFTKVILAVLMLVIFMLFRNIKSTTHQPSDIPPSKGMVKKDSAELKETIDNIEPDEETPHGTPIDFYLKIMIEVDEELRKEGILDPNSYRYNIHLNNRISERLNNKSNKKIKLYERDFEHL